MNNYEKLIEFIINEDHAKASELFHKIVVEKSREIYESIMDEEEFGGSKVDGMIHDIEADEQGMNEEGDEEDELGDGDEFAGDDFGGDVDSDDMSSDDEFGGEMGGDEFGGEEGEAGLENRVVDLEDALDDLKSEFDRLMGDHGDMSGDTDGMNSDMGGEEGDEFGGAEMGSDDENMGEGKDCSGSGDEMMEGDSGEESGSGEDLEEDFAFMREYVEKVSLPANKSEGHEVGSKGTSVGVNKKGIVAGKNDMGGTTANIVKGGSEKAPDGTSPKTNAKKPSDLPHAGKFANVPGADAGKQWWGKAKSEGNSEGKETGNGKSVNVNKKSEITGKNTGNKPGKK